MVTKLPSAPSNLKTALRSGTSTHRALSYAMQLNIVVWNRSMGYVWNRKTGIILAGLCVAGVLHILLSTFMSHGENNAPLIPSSHSKAGFKPWTRSTDISRIQESYVLPTTSNKKIIILGYMRSGSTLTGDIIQSHPDVFYVYEPLLYLWDYFVPEKMEVTRNLRRRTKSFWKGDDTEITPPLDFMTYMFNCNLTVSNLKFLTNVAHSRDFQIARCPVYQAGMNIVNASDHCVHVVNKRCSKANAVLLKVVRLTMDEADTYLERNPRVRVIHLVRDPRGVLLSRMRFNDKETGEMHNNYSNICRRIFEDVRVSQMISYKHSGRILTIRYEDLAQDLKGYTRKLFKFLDMPMHPKVLQHLEEITSTQDNLSSDGVKAKKTRRKNPYKTAYHWRSVLPFSVIRRVDKACAQLYRVMGYRHFTTEADLRNEKLSARSKYYGDGLMTAVL